MSTLEIIDSEMTTALSSFGVFFFYTIKKLLSRSLASYSHLGTFHSDVVKGVAYTSHFDKVCWNFEKKLCRFLRQVLWLQ